MRIINEVQFRKSKNESLEKIIKNSTSFSQLVYSNKVMKFEKVKFCNLRLSQVSCFHFSELRTAYLKIKNDVHTQFHSIQKLGTLFENKMLRVCLLY